MSFTLKTAAMLLAGCSLTQAAIVSLYSGPDCTGDVQDDVNVWDTSCATWMNGFQSFIITTPGGDGQFLMAYSENSCYGTTEDLDYYACQDATQVGECVNAYLDGPNGGSNAMGSSIFCGWSVDLQGLPDTDWDTSFGADE